MFLNTLIAALSFSAFSTLGFAGDEPDWCVRCHGNQTPAKPTEDSPPLLPTAYSMNWKMYEVLSNDRPPFANVETQATSLINGSTYYDWDHKRMTEIYQERCIDIFPDGRDYPCQFISREDKTYFIKFNPESQKPATCCLWRKSGFWAPRPDVLLNMKRDKQEGDTNWWIMDIPLPGPFGYGTNKVDHHPEAFWFPVINGWVQQVFSAYKAGMPDAVHFELPAVCSQDLQECPQ